MLISTLDLQINTFKRLNARIKFYIKKVAFKCLSNKMIDLCRYKSIFCAIIVLDFKMEVVWN